MQFRVVVNEEEQHSVWATGQDLPAGWRAEGFSGTRAECLTHIEEVWPDITPLSARAAVGGRNA